jgi:hypothetical protein
LLDFQDKIHRYQSPLLDSLLFKEINQIQLAIASSTQAAVVRIDPAQDQCSKGFPNENIIANTIKKTDKSKLIQRIFNIRLIFGIGIH